MARPAAFRQSFLRSAFVDSAAGFNPRLARGAFRPCGFSLDLGPGPVLDLLDLLDLAGDVAFAVSAVGRLPFCTAAAAVGLRLRAALPLESVFGCLPPLLPAESAFGCCLEVLAPRRPLVVSGALGDAGVTASFSAVAEFGLDAAAFFLALDEPRGGFFDACSTARVAVLSPAAFPPFSVVVDAFARPSMLLLPLLSVLLGLCLLALVGGDADVGDPFREELHATPPAVTSTGCSGCSIGVLGRGRFLEGGTCPVATK